MGMRKDMFTLEGTWRDLRLLFDSSSPHSTGSPLDLPLPSLGSLGLGAYVLAHHQNDGWGIEWEYTCKWHIWGLVHRYPLGHVWTTLVKDFSPCVPSSRTLNRIPAENSSYEGRQEFGSSVVYDLPQQNRPREHFGAQKLYQPILAASVFQFPLRKIHLRRAKTLMRGTRGRCSWLGCWSPECRVMFTRIMMIKNCCHWRQWRLVKLGHDAWPGLKIHIMTLDKAK